MAEAMSPERIKNISNQHDETERKLKRAFAQAGFILYSYYHAIKDMSRKHLLFALIGKSKPPELLRRQTSRVVEQTPYRHYFSAVIKFDKYIWQQAMYEYDNRTGSIAGQRHGDK